MMYPYVSTRVATKRVAAILIVAVLVVLVLVNLPVSQPGFPPTNAGLQTFKKPFTPSGALHIPLAGPVVNLVKGDRVNVTYEYEALNYNSSWYGMTIRFPTVDGVFTEPKGGLVFIPVLYRNVTLTRASFSNGTATQTSEIITSNFTLDPNVEPFATTLKLAIMANTTYGTFQLAVKWEYSIWIEANDTTLASNWSTFGNHGGLQESTIWPGALVYVIYTSPEYSTVGSIFTAELSGLVSGQSYWMEVEDPFTGISISKQWDNASVGATVFNVTIPFEDDAGTMAAAPWLVHIHDADKQILYSLPVYLSYPTSAAAFFKVAPTTCGPLEYNGVARSSGTKVLNITTNKSYSLQAEACSGYTFASWSEVGGGAIFADAMRASTTVNILYNTTITANYVPDFPPA
jgi:hypothetical protein